jgi:U6 snRNA-associated Sm-like protein LSm2
MIFFSFFKTLIGQKLTIELKNGVTISGSLISVDQYLNVKLSAISIENPQEHPQLSSLKNCFIRGSVIRYLLLGLSYHFLLYLLLFLDIFMSQLARLMWNYCKTPLGKKTLLNNEHGQISFFSFASFITFFNGN